MRATLTTTPLAIVTNTDAQRRTYAILSPQKLGAAVLQPGDALTGAPSMTTAARWDFGQAILIYDLDPGLALWAATETGTLSLDILPLTDTVASRASLDPTAGRKVRLGRLQLPTMLDALEEQLGDGVDTVGPVVLGGDRAARGRNITLPVHGVAGIDSDPFEMGARARRQTRALLDNTDARLDGLFCVLDFDREQDGWVVCGGGRLSYNDGGPTFHDYKVELTDAYHFSARTHQPARRAVLTDRRAAFVDTLSGWAGVTYALSVPATPTLILPAAARRVRVNGALTGSLATRSHPSGGMPLLPYVGDSDLVTFELDATMMHASDVIVLNRHGDTTNTAPDSWEEVYGPNQFGPGDWAGDAPVVQNGLARVRWVPDALALAVDTPGSDGSWTERARVVVSGASADMIPAVTGWTPEGATIALDFEAAGDAARALTIITLRRGWLGPLIEHYAEQYSGTPSPSIYASLLPTGNTQISRGLAQGGAVTTQWTAGTADTTTYTLDAGWGYVQATPTTTAPALAVATTQATATIALGSDTAAYGAPRPTLKYRAAARDAYAAAQLAFTAPVDAAHPTARATLDGPQDLGRQFLIDAQARPVIVAR